MINNKINETNTLLQIKSFFKKIKLVCFMRHWLGNFLGKGQI